MRPVSFKSVLKPQKFLLVPTCKETPCDSTDVPRLYAQAQGVDQLMCNQISNCKSSVPYDRLTISLITCCAKCKVSDVRFLEKVELEFYMFDKPCVTTAAWLLVCSVDLVLDTNIPMSLILSTSIHRFGMIN